MKKQLFLAVFLLGLFAGAVETYAHSVVSPSTALTSKYETFSLSVPTEKDIPTVSVRLVIPVSLDRVTPFVKPGWKINIKKEGEHTTEIEWGSGVIPAGQKDVFQFTARTPSSSATLIWKAYQTYKDGSVVAWDMDPNSENAASEVQNPYSTTEVRPDESGVQKNTKENNTGSDKALAITALAFSVVALGIASRKKR